MTLWRYLMIMTLRARHTVAASTKPMTLWRYHHPTGRRSTRRRGIHEANDLVAAHGSVSIQTPALVAASTKPMTLWREQQPARLFRSFGRGIHEANDLVADDGLVRLEDWRGRGIHEANDLVAEQSMP